MALTTWRGFRSVLGEAWLVAVAGLLFAMVANQLAPHGLNLTRNYFPTGGGTNQMQVRTILPAATNRVLMATVQPMTTNLALALPPPAQPNPAGQQMAVSNQVIAWFGDARRLTQRIVFVDARNEADYLAGHVPGAWLFNPYEPEKYFPAVMPVAQGAQIIVVYCHGGNCDDSLTAATLLKEVGVRGEKIYVYGGGMGEWESLGQPLETGPQNSGQIHKGAP